MSYISRSSSSMHEVSYIRVANKYCVCGRKFVIRRSDSSLNPQRLYYKCDACNNFKWCKVVVDESSSNQQQECESRGRGSMDTRDGERQMSMHAELKQLKKKIKRQQKVVNVLIKLGIVLVVIIVVVLLK
ncbi:uncharacterized protein LOC110731058 [Chenopodium quinoa]|uniref:uncharacterized protein LOC110731058 n=1 Tax=Chenopodium quinoa TaxID=63459 RepID=UPI000B795AA4|nr:uncharacterized protein LOC110731058 [Chenopodium quinoa]